MTDEYERKATAAVERMRRRFPDATVDDIASIALCNPRQLDEAVVAIADAETLDALRVELTRILA
ncbi:MAG TPA: hypothetical protein VGC41_18755 [Kofleriaceae bacterium]